MNLNQPAPLNVAIFIRFLKKFKLHTVYCGFRGEKPIFKVGFKLAIDCVQLDVFANLHRHPAATLAMLTRARVKKGSLCKYSAVTS